MKKIAVYCRVSTDKEDQKNSLENQKKFFTEYISKNPSWEFAEIYVDEGISGTNTKKRKAFNQMIADAEAGVFDFVITKEISRFARNTLDSIYYTRLLKSKQIGVYFINDNINTLDSDSELRLTIMASIAQEESRKTSERVKWGQKRSMEKGVVFGTKVYGYYLTNGQLEINPEEAEVVKLIYFKYLTEGKGVNIIARELDASGTPTPTRIKHWTHATLLRILKNEKYTGTLKQKKQITTDYLNHSRKRNEGEEDFIIIENNHPLIIENDMFNKVQEEILRRRKFKFDKTKYSNRYSFSGKLVCGFCKTRFKRRINNPRAKTPQTVWECGISVRHGKEKINQAGVKIGCNSKAISEKVIENAFLCVLEDFIIDKPKIIESIESSLKKALSEAGQDQKQAEKLQAMIDRTQSKKKKLVELFMDNMISKDEFNSMRDELSGYIGSCKAEIEKMKAIQARQQNFNELMGNIKHKVENIVNLNEFSGEVCKGLLNKVIVHGREHLEFFINGASLAKNFDIPLYEMQYQQRKVLFK